MRRLFATPPRTFATVSLVLIVATLLATSFTQSRFFREAVIVGGMVRALALSELVAEDMEHYGQPSSSCSAMI